MDWVLNCLFATRGGSWGSWRDYVSLTQVMSDHARSSAAFISLRLVRRAA